ncbi:MAG: pyruvate kinase [Planctomycetota bacterium]|nr:pyruvate kinase [Planctomycetota bacterium]
MNPDLERRPVPNPKLAQPFAHTKIVATIGPASEDKIGELIDAGMSVARINFSHGTPEDFLRRVQKIRRESDARMASIGILTDIQGPKMRMGRFDKGLRELKEGDILRLVEGKGMSKPGEVVFEFTGFQEAVRRGHRVLLADGQVELIADDVTKEGITAHVTRAGNVADRKGVHFPDSQVAYELPTEEDRANLALAREAGIDMIGISFVAKRLEIQAVRALCPDALMISKIERQAALDALDELLIESDGIMVARGDLGVEAELEQLPLIQKSIIQAAMRAGKFTITATEMLESMIESSRPTRAEVTDVANAVLDGTDAVMLSAETAVGAHPIETVATMTKIARAVETSQRYRDIPRPLFRASEATFSNATALAAVQASEALNVTKIVCFTETGNTVRLISRYRPNAEVIALTPHQRTVNHMTVLAHVRPLLFRREKSLEDMLYMASEMLVVRGMAQYGDSIVFVAGVPAGMARTTNVMKLHKIGEEVKLH